MSNAAQEPRRWTLHLDWCETTVVGGPPANFEVREPEEVPVIEASVYDALLAERDALKESLALEREQVEIGADARSELYDEVQAYMMETRAMIDALKAELAALKAKAERLHEALRKHSCHTLYSSISGYASASRCRLCNSVSDYGRPESHAPDCPAHPDFLTTSATESPL